MKRLITILLAVLLTISFVTFAGCHRDEGKEVNTNMTQLYVGTYDGGVGREWLDAAAKRFEEFYKDYSFEPGKTGVQVWVDCQKGTMSGTALMGTIAKSTNEVFFTEEVFYNQFVEKGLLHEITDAVTEPLTEYGETESIEDKMVESQTDYFKSADGKYYAIPFWEGYSGLVYDVDVFTSKNFYFAENKNNGNNGFVRNAEEKRSLGPDNQPNTYDDGLPATYDEFFALLDRMYFYGMVPIAWSGDNQDYFQWFLSSLMTDYEGMQKMMLNYNLNGEADIATVDSSGKVTISQTPIQMSNGYELAKQPGAYYALKFAERLINNTNYYNNLSFSPSQSQTAAQDDFLRGIYDDAIEDIGFLIDGTWWINEASDVFLDMEANELPGKSERNLGFLPYPKATEEKLQSGQKQTLMAILESCCFINGNIKENKVEVAEKFLRFCHTDVSMIEFMQICGVMKPYKYTVEETDLNKMNSFTRSVWQAKQASDIVYPYNNNKLYNADGMNFRSVNLFISKIGDMEYPMVSSAIKNNHLTAEQIFEGMYKYRQERWQKYNIS